MRAGGPAQGFPAASRQHSPEGRGHAQGSPCSFSRPATCSCAVLVANAWPSHSHCCSDTPPHPPTPATPPGRGSRSCRRWCPPCARAPRRSSRAAPCPPSQTCRQTRACLGCDAAAGPPACLRSRPALSIAASRLRFPWMSLRGGFRAAWLQLCCSKLGSGRRASRPFRPLPYRSLVYRTVLPRCTS